MLKTITPKDGNHDIFSLSVFLPMNSIEHILEWTLQRLSTTATFTNFTSAKTLPGRGIMIDITSLIMPLTNLSLETNLSISVTNLTLLRTI